MQQQQQQQQAPTYGYPAQGPGVYQGGYLPYGHHHHHLLEDYTQIPTTVAEISARTFSQIVMGKPCGKRKRPDDSDEDCVNNNQVKLRKTTHPGQGQPAVAQPLPPLARRPGKLNANDREKRRRQDLNAAFEELQRIVPSLPNDKLTKDKTLKLAVMYINFLKHKIIENKSYGKISDECVKNVLGSTAAAERRNSTRSNRQCQADDFSYEFGIWRIEKQYAL